MLRADCGQNGNALLEWALDYLPDSIAHEWIGKLAFVCTAESDGKRLTHSFREEREIIVLSERIVPKKYDSECDPEVRYFIFAVLHEIAHAVNDDRSPRELSSKENDAQEERANCLALKWFNAYIHRKNIQTLPPFTREELALAKERNRERMRAEVGR